LAPELSAVLVVSPDVPFRAEYETIRAGCDRDRTSELVFLESERVAVELGRIIVLPVAELETSGVGLGKTGCGLRLVREAADREIE